MSYQLYKGKGVIFGDSQISVIEEQVKQKLCLPGVGYYDVS
jgi:hypothetical protein